MKPVQALLSGRGGCPARREYGSGSRLGGLERGMPAAMKETGIVEAGHDGHKSVESRAFFRHAVFTRRAKRLPISTRRTSGQRSPGSTRKRGRLMASPWITPAKSGRPHT